MILSSPSKVNGSLLSLAHQMQHFYVPITKTMSGWKLSGAEYQKQKAQQEYNLQNNHVHKWIDQEIS